MKSFSRFSSSEPWFVSLLRCLEHGRLKRARKREASNLSQQIERLETRTLLSALPNPSNVVDPSGVVGYWRMEVDNDATSLGLSIPNEVPGGEPLKATSAMIRSGTGEVPVSTIPQTGQTNSYSLDGLVGPGESNPDINAHVSYYTSLDTPSITVEFWLRTTENDAIVVRRRSSGGTGSDGFQIGNFGNDGGLRPLKIEYFVDNGLGGATQITLNTGYFFTTNWTHAAWTYDAPSGVGKFYANGQLIAQNAGTPGRALAWASPSTGTPLDVGVNMDGNSNAILPDGTRLSADHGIFDELRISGSALAPSQFLIGNGRPTVNAGPDSIIDEGGTFTSNGSFTDPNNDSFSATVNYGDGSETQSLSLNPDKTFSLNHVYSDNGTYTVTVSVGDNFGTPGTDTAVVTVNNVAPTVNVGDDVIVDDGTTFDGGSFTGSGSFSDPGSDTWNATVNYGDGTGDQPLALNADNTFTLSHAFLHDGVYTVTVSVSDDDLGVGSDSLVVTVNGPAAADLDSDGNLIVLGTSGDDTITVDSTDLSNVVVTIDNGGGPVVYTGSVAADRTVTVNAFDGNDNITVVGPLDTIVNADQGDDTVHASGGNETLRGGSGADTFFMTNSPVGTTATVDGGLDADSFLGNFAGDFAGTLTLLRLQPVNIVVNGNFSGHLSAPEDDAESPTGRIDSLHVAGSVTSGAIIEAGAITHVTVEADMDGTLIAHGAGTIDGVTIGGDLGGTVIAVEDATAGSGTISDVAVGSVSDTGTIDGGSLTTIAVEADMDGTLIAHGAGTIGELTIGGNLNGTVTASDFDANGNVISGTGSIAVLTVGAGLNGTVTTGKLTGVFSQGNIHAGLIHASVEALAFGSLTRTDGTTVTAESATNADALLTLGSGSGLVQSNSTFRVPFGEAHKVAMFLVTTSGATTFDSQKILFADQIIDNQSVTAVVQVVSSGTASTVQSVDLLGDGGSITTAQRITTSITSTGPLGDLILSASQGIAANVTAPSIIGNVDSTNGPISGTIQTTSGDIGRALKDATGKITGVTSLHAVGGGITGKVIARGNLVSSIRVDGGLSGVVAAQGDIGAIQRGAAGKAVVGTDAAHSLTRFGGILVNGGMSGKIVALGNVFGDLTFNGGITGRVAVRGQQVAGLDAQRFGILGRLTINGSIGSTAAIVSRGVIGDDGTYIETIAQDTDAIGTQITFGSDKGILAAGGDINFGKTGSANQTGTFENVGVTGSAQYANGANKAAIDAIFTQGGALLSFDTVVGGTKGLDLILGDLAALRVGSDGKLTGTVT